MSWKPIEEHIKDAFCNLANKYAEDVKSGKIVPRKPVEDYIDDNGIRVRRYEKENKGI